MFCYYISRKLYTSLDKQLCIYQRTNSARTFSQFHWKSAIQLMNKFVRQIKTAYWNNICLQNHTSGHTQRGFRVCLWIMILKSTQYTGQENDPKFRRSVEPDLVATADVIVRLSQTIPQNNAHKYSLTIVTLPPIFLCILQREIFFILVLLADIVCLEMKCQQKLKWRN